MPTTGHLVPSMENGEADILLWLDPGFVGFAFLWTLVTAHRAVNGSAGARRPGRTLDGTGTLLTASHQSPYHYILVL